MRKKENYFANGEGTVIGKGTVIDGNMKASASTRIDGEVNGDIVSEGIIVVGETGVVNGSIQASEVRVAGKVVGNVSVTGKIEIVAKGYLLGDIKTGSLMIDEDAMFQGKCTMTDMPGVPEQTKTEKSKTTRTRAVKKEEVVQEAPAENSAE